MQAAIAPQHMQTIFDRYSAAWTARDPDRIAALHTPETVFRLRLDQPPVTGREQVRATFAALFEQWPEFGFATDRVHLGPHHWVLDWTLTSVLTDPDGTRRSVRFDCADIVVVDSEGLVERKDTFVDFLQVQHALTPTAAA